VVKPVLPVLQDRQALLVYKVIKVYKAIKVSRVLVVRRVIKVLEDHKDRKVLQALLVLEE
tara:strand:+ start:1180 stop:1359 length:180 start_codon:yes stop_codon:yes gene_type:complete